MILGSIDVITGEHAEGWIYSAALPGYIKVQAFINHQLIGEAVADRYRPDLEEAGFGLGECAFEINFSYAIEPIYLPFVEIRPEGSSLKLPRTSVAGLNDYFSQLYSRYPLAGRYASLFAGLWTDRTDAHSLLKARVDIESISRADSGALSRFIQEGLVVLQPDSLKTPDFTLGSAPAAARPDSPADATMDTGVGETTDGADLAGFIRNIFFSEDTLRLLRTVLEDQPIAIAAGSVMSANSEFSQFSTLEILPSPSECLGLVATISSEPITVEVLRSSHRYPEFRGDGHSRWTSREVVRETARAAATQLPVDLYAIGPGQIALVGPGLMYRLIATPPSRGLWILAVSARLGLMRFRENRPAEEISHRSGARIWLSGNV